MDKLRVFLLIFISSSSQAGGKSIHVPENDKQRLTAFNLSLTTEKLYNAYMSSNLEERRFAEMYAIGVIDSTEGSLWCDYSVASPDALQEQVFAGLKEAIKKNPQVRASETIKSRLKKLLPCKEQK